MSEITHDPELPFALVASSGKLIARFATSAGADAAQKSYFIRSNVVDTTPPPKIPKNARIIAWRPDGYPRKSLMYAEHQGLVSSDRGYLWRMSGERGDIGQDMLESIIGDHPVSVLMTREAYVA